MEVVETWVVKGGGQGSWTDQTLPHTSISRILHLWLHYTDYTSVYLNILLWFVQDIPKWPRLRKTKKLDFRELSDVAGFIHSAGILQDIRWNTSQCEFAIEHGETSLRMAKNMPQTNCRMLCLSTKHGRSSMGSLKPKAELQLFCMQRWELRENQHDLIFSTFQRQWGLEKNPNPKLKFLWLFSSTAVQHSESS